MNPSPKSLWIVLVFVFFNSISFAHVTPNIQLVPRGDFVKENLSGATRFFEKHVRWDGNELASVKKSTGWLPSEEDAKIYVGRTDSGELVGLVAFLWMPSEHGPIGIGVAFDNQGKILRAEVTDAGSEPLTWVQPLLAANGLSIYQGLALSSTPDASAIAPAVKGSMSRYYARVIADGIKRAQALTQVALSEKY